MIEDRDAALPQPVSEHHAAPEQPEVSAVPREARPYQGHRAGVVTRLMASTVDLVVALMLLAVLYGGFAALVFLRAPQRFQFPQASSEAVVTLGLLVLTAYLGFSWATTGRTYGDHLWGLRVVSSAGHPPGAALAVVRAVLCVLFPLGLFWCAVSRANRSVQDIVLRTSVVYDWSGHRM